MKRSAIPASTLALFFALQLGLPALAGDPCSAPWVTQRRSAARDDGRRFSLVRGGSFRDKEWSYIVGITYTIGENSLILGIFGSTSGTPKQLFTRKIGILSPEEIRPDEELSDSCPAPQLGPFFEATVVDLDGDGAHELVVESNESGTCAECKSEVRVYTFNASKVNEAVDEDESEVTFGQGKGLSVDSWVLDAAGETVPTHKTFFMPGTPAADRP